MGKKKTHEEYVAELAVKNPTVEVVDTYNGAHNKIMHRCKTCNYEWQATPHNTLAGKGCPKCAGTMKRTHDEYVELVEAMHSNIEVVGVYVNNNTPILHRCTIHNHLWMAHPNNILSGHGCRMCANDLMANNFSKSTLDYVKDVASVNTNIEIIGEYVNAHVPILHRCKIDGYEWLAKPNNILSGKGCPKCAGSITKTHDEYVGAVNIVNPDIEVVDDYIDSRTPIKHKCKIDGNIWYAAPYNILVGKGCPRCNESSGERMVRQWLSKNNISFVFQKIFDDCVDINALPFDFYLPDYNAAIEYQGGQHYFPVEHFGGEDSFKRQQRHDKIKEDYCSANNIRLLCIPYYADVEKELSNFLFI